MITKRTIPFPSTTSIIIICTIVFAITFVIDLLSPSFISFSEILVLFGAENIPDILNGELWRFVLPAFLHADLIHLVLNLYGIWIIGRFIETYFDGKTMFSVFIISATVGSIISSIATFFIFSLNYSSFQFIHVSVGASGGLFGLMGLLLAGKLLNKHNASYLPIEEKSLFLLIGINLIYGFWVPGINNWAHMGGLVAGIVLGFIIKPSTNLATASRQLPLKNILFYFSLTLVLFSVILHLLSIII